MKKVLNIPAPGDFGVVHIGGASVTIRSESPSGELVIDVHVEGGLSSKFYRLDEDGDASVVFRREGKHDLRATLARNGRIHDAPPRDDHPHLDAQRGFDDGDTGTDYRHE